MTEKRKKRNWIWKLLIGVVLVFLILGIVGGIIGMNMLKPYMERADEYDLKTLSDMPTTTTFYDRNGIVLGQIFTEDRIILDQKDIPKNMIKALMGAEDKRFYDHPGVDIWGVMRAMYVNFRKGSTRQGGSTVTQQLAKNLIGDSRRTMDRKLVELFLAFRMEKNLSKDEIMTLYLNRVYFGNGYFGVEAAAKGYFGISASQLSISQSAFLAGIVRAPSSYSPYTNYERILHRRNLILAAMLDERIINKTEYTDAVADVIKIIPRKVRGITSHFTAFTLQELQQILNFDDMESIPKGLSIYTTLDMRLQRRAERILADEISDLKRADKKSGKPDIEYEGSIVVSDKNGGIVVYCAGLDFWKNQYDHIRLSRRESNYLLSPFLFGLSFSKMGANPASLLDGTHLTPEEMNQKDIQLTRPRSRFGNPLIIAQDALALENRSVIRRVAAVMGSDTMNKWLKNANIPLAKADEKKFFNEIAAPTIYELMPLYGALINGGKMQPLHVISRIQNSAGVTIYEQKNQKPKQILSATDAAQLGLMLHSGMHDNHTTLLLPEKLKNLPFVAYSSFSNGNLDSWTFGYDSDYVIGTWVGSKNNQPLGETQETRVKSWPLWANALILMEDKKKKSVFPHSEKGFVKVEIDRFAGSVEGFSYLSPEKDNTFVYLTPDQLQNFSQTGSKSSLIPQESVLWFQTILGERANSQIRPRPQDNAGRHPSAREIPRSPEYIIPGIRGDIISSDNIVLATDRKMQSLVLPWPSLDDAKDEKEAIAWMTERILAAEKFYRRRADARDQDLRMLYRYRRYHPITVISELGEDEVNKFLSSDDSLKDFSLQGQPKRVYPQNSAAAHILGYTGRTQRRGSKKYQANEVLFDTYSGRSGIETIFDDDLTGKPGQVIITTTPEGFTESHLLIQSPGVGNNIRLTLNMEWQAALEEALMKVKSGSGVILDVKTGGVVAMASMPTFNPNDFVPAVPTELWQELSSNPDRPLSNKVIQEHYPPGSVFKIVTALASMEAAILDPGRKYHAQGMFNAGGVIFNFKKENGWYDFQTALTYSYNSYFMDLALLTGRDNYIKTSQEIGIGKITGIDLPGEIPGFMPTPDFVRRKHGRIMGAGDMANTSIGQGDVLVTPLQLAYLMSGVASRGEFYRPHVVKAIETPDGSIVRSFPPVKLKEFRLEDYDWDTLHDAMKNAVQVGTAKKLKLNEITVSAKTGTAQIGGSRKRYVAWIAGFFPVDNPRYAFAFEVIGDWDEAITGGRTAGEVARNTLLNYYKLQRTSIPIPASDIPDESMEESDEIIFMPEEQPAGELTAGEELMLRMNNPELLETNSIPDQPLENPDSTPPSPTNNITPPLEQEPPAAPSPESSAPGENIQIISIPEDTPQTPSSPEMQIHDITPPALR